MRFLWDSPPRKGRGVSFLYFLMAATDNIKLIHDQLWALLEARTEWAALVKVGNRIKLRFLGTNKPEKTNLAEADYPQTIIRPASGSNDLWDSDPTFATHSSGGPLDWTENQTYVFRIQVKSQLLRIYEATSLFAETQAALRAGGPRLGLSNVVSIKDRWAITRIKNSEEDGQEREQIDIDLTILMQVVTHPA